MQRATTLLYSSAVCRLVLRFSSSSSLYSCNLRLASCADSGDISLARHLFDGMPQRNSISWTVIVDAHMKHFQHGTAMNYFNLCPLPYKNSVILWTAAINGLSFNDLHRDALLLFHRMISNGMMPNNVTFTCTIRSCIAISKFELGCTTVCLIIKTGFENYTSVCNSMITFYMRMCDWEAAKRVFYEMKEKDVVSWTAVLDVCFNKGNLEEARCVFDEMPERNEVSWSTMIARFAQHGEAFDSLNLFVDMFLHGFKPNVSCIASVITASADAEKLGFGAGVHGFAIKAGFDLDVHVASSLIIMYCRCQECGDGRLVFDLIHNKNIVCWNSMISGYSYDGRLEEAENLFNSMTVPNLVSWNAILSGYDRLENYGKVLERFNDMLMSGHMPNNITFSTILHACANLPLLEKGRYVHAKVLKLGMEDGVFTGTALTDMYSKSGDIISAKLVFMKMPEKNEVSWTTMIQGLADSGYAEEALALFEIMNRTGLVPNEAMFLSVLFACSHCGLVDKGLRYFESMSKVYGILPSGKHYTCIVDLLSRAGRLGEAEALIRSMPFKEDPDTWAALLSGCNTYKNEEIGERAGAKLLEIGKENPASFILLSNKYASARRWKDVAKIRLLMRKAGLKKVGGCSWIQIRDHCHAFFSWDPLHPKSTEIYLILKLLLSEMRP